MAARKKAEPAAAPAETVRETIDEAEARVLKARETTVAVLENRMVWDRLSKTDEKFTKPFERPGFKGTDINPTWRMLRMTETFGPIGKGWGYEELQHVFHGNLVFIQVRVWYVLNGEKLYTGTQWGGDKLVANRKDGREVPNDEAFKMAVTDAMGKCLSQIGVAADVYLKQFDDSKYREEIAQQYDARDRALERARNEERRGRTGQPPAAEEKGDAPSEPANDDFPGDRPVEADDVARTEEAKRKEIEAWIATEVHVFNVLEGPPRAVEAAWRSIHAQVCELNDQGWGEQLEELINAYQRAKTRVLAKARPAPAQAAE